MKKRPLRATRKAAESLEDVIRMACRVQTRLRKEGIELRWTMQFVPIDRPKPDNSGANP